MTSLAVSLHLPSNPLPLPLPLRLGVPFAPGQLADPAWLALRDPTGTPQPLQCTPLERWPDGSLRHALVELLAPPEHGSSLWILEKVSAPGQPPTFPEGLQVVAQPDVWEVRGGDRLYLLSKQGDFLLSLTQAGQLLLPPRALELVLHDPTLQKLPFHFQGWSLEVAGPLRCAFVGQGAFQAMASGERMTRLLGEGPVGLVRRGLRQLEAALGTVAPQELLRVRLRLEIHAAGPCRLEVTVHNPRAALHAGGLWDLGDPGSCYFRDLSLWLTLPGREPQLWRQVEASTPWSAPGLGGGEEAGAESRQRGAGEPGWLLYQDSSGGERWDCHTHQDRSGRLTVSFPGYREFGSRARDRATPFALEPDRLRLGDGRRATPVLGLQTDVVGACLGVEHFWEQFPKALEVHGTALRVGLFPGESGQDFELQGGERKRQAVWFELGTAGESLGAQVAVGEALGERADLHPGEELGSHRPAGLTVQAARVRRLLTRPFPTLDAGYVAGTGVSRGVADGHLKPIWAVYQAYLEQAISGPRPFSARREEIDEYGWRHFGDLFADHEAMPQAPPLSERPLHLLPGTASGRPSASAGGLETDGLVGAEGLATGVPVETMAFKPGAGAPPRVAHFNNQYDPLLGFCLSFWQTGDSRWLELALPLARHVVDIDIYHTDADRPAYNHGLFWHTDHYLDAGRATHRTFSRQTLRDREAAGHPTPGYGGGPSDEHNYSGGLRAAWQLTGDPDFKDAVLELAGWVLAMDDGGHTWWAVVDPAPTGYASQTASPDFHRVGRGAGNSILTLLDGYQISNKRIFLVKAEELIARCVHPQDDIDALDLGDAELRWTYLVFLQALGAYLDLKHQAGEQDQAFCYARDSLIHYADWMAQREGPYFQALPRVLIPTESWPAQDARKSQIFYHAWRFGPEARRAEYARLTRFYLQQGLTDLLRFPTAGLTRPLSIMLTHGRALGRLENHPEDQVPYLEHAHPFDPPTVFEPQAAAARAKFRQRLTAAGRYGLLLVSRKLLERLVQ